MSAVNVMGLADAEAALRSAGVAEAAIRKDAARLEQAWFGAHYLPYCPGRGLLLGGLRSGLEAVLALQANSECRVQVVQSDDAAPLEGACDLLRRLGGERFSISRWNGISLHQGRFDMMRIDAAEWIEENAIALLRAVRPKVFVGEAALDRPDHAGRLLRELRESCCIYQVRLKDSDIVLSEAMPTEVEVSVVVPAYGVENYLDRCLESLVGQTLSRLEIIVVDDGSIDRTGAIADEWASRYPGRIRTIHRTNGGCAAARMTGLAASRGEYVAFVDADDWATPQMMERLHTAALLHRAEIAQCGYVEVFGNGQRRETIDCPVPDRSRDPAWGSLLKDPQTYLAGRPTIWRRLYRRDFLINSGAEFPAHLPRFDDLPFQFVTLGKVRRMVAIPEAHYFYESARPGQDIAVRDTRLFVHFPIFEWLADATLEWTTRKIEKKLALTQLNSHLWALSVIDSSLRSAYRHQAALLFLRRRPHLSFLDLVRICWSRGSRGLRFLVVSLLMAVLGKPRKTIVDSTLRTIATSGGSS